MVPHPWAPPPLEAKVTTLQQIFTPIQALRYAPLIVKTYKTEKLEETRYIVPCNILFWYIGDAR